ncbi:MAG TPA: hypothetical protein VNK95_24860 [Caldilineaceae bacterium]|nr:hypothetical protein [Caldilineaceae bacterium]
MAGYGPLDLLARIYRNENGTLVDLQAGLPGFWQGDVAWGDYDGDGDLDMIFLGEVAHLQSTVHLFRHEGERFAESEIGLPPVKGGTVRWGDLDGDGMLELFIASVPEYWATVTNIYHLTDCPSALRLPILLNGEAALRSR